MLLPTEMPSSRAFPPSLCLFFSCSRERPPLAERCLPRSDLGLCRARSDLELAVHASSDHCPVAAGTALTLLLRVVSTDIRVLVDEALALSSAAPESMLEAPETGRQGPRKVQPLSPEQRAQRRARVAAMLPVCLRIVEAFISLLCETVAGEEDEAGEHGHAEAGHATNACVRTAGVGGGDGSGGGERSGEEAQRETSMGTVTGDEPAWARLPATVLLNVQQSLHDVMSTILEFIQASLKCVDPG